MAEPIARDRFLRELRAARVRWEAALAAVPGDRLETPGVSGDGRWTVKDVVAHVLWHEREMIGLLASRALVGSPLWQQPLHERNAAIHAMHREQELATVLADAAAAWRELLPLLVQMSEAELNEPARFAGMPAEWLPWDLIAGNTSRHYEEHAAQIERWLGRIAPAAD